MSKSRTQEDIAEDLRAILEKMKNNLTESEMTSFIKEVKQEIKEDVAKRLKANDS